MPRSRFDRSLWIFWLQCVWTPWEDINILAYEIIFWECDREREKLKKVKLFRGCGASGSSGAAAAGRETAEQTIAEHEGREADGCEPLESREHVQMEPVAGVQAEDGRQSGVKAERPQRVLRVPEVDAHAEPLEKKGSRLLSMGVKLIRL